MPRPLRAVGQGDSWSAAWNEGANCSSSSPGRLPCTPAFHSDDISSSQNSAVAWDAEMCAEAEAQLARAAEAGAAGLVVPVEMEGSGEVNDLPTLDKLAGVASAKGIAIVPEIRCRDHTPGGNSAALAAALRGASAAADSGVVLVSGSVSRGSPTTIRPAAPTPIRSSCFNIQ